MLGPDRTCSVPISNVVSVPPGNGFLVWFPYGNVSATLN